MLTFFLLATMTDWEMIFYGTILPPEQSHTPTSTKLSVNQNQTSEKIAETIINSGECRVTTTKCLGLFLLISAILIPDSF